MVYAAIILANAIIFGLAGTAILSRYNKEGTGCLLGFLLGPIGLLIAWTLRDDKKTDETQMLIHMARPQPQSPPASDRKERKCPYCAEYILDEARVCKHCGRDVEPKVTATNPDAETDEDFFESLGIN